MPQHNRTRLLQRFASPFQNITSRDHVGYALYVAQRGGKHRDTKTLSGFGVPAGILSMPLRRNSPACWKASKRGESATWPPDLSSRPSAPKSVRISSLTRLVTGASFLLAVAMICPA
jgi:hypothetical protein